MNDNIGFEIVGQFDVGYEGDLPAILRVQQGMCVDALTPKTVFVPFHDGDHYRCILPHPYLPLSPPSRVIPMYRNQDMTE